MAKAISPKKLDAMISEIYKRNCSGIQIDIMDISKIFAAGRQAFDASASRPFELRASEVEAAVVATVQAIRKN
jgi:hypothetical protein